MSTSESREEDHHKGGCLDALWVELVSLFVIPTRAAQSLSDHFVCVVEEGGARTKPKRTPVDHTYSRTPEITGSSEGAANSLQRQTATAPTRPRIAPTSSWLDAQPTTIYASLGSILFAQYTPIRNDSHIRGTMYQLQHVTIQLVDGSASIRSYWEQ